MSAPDHWIVAPVVLPALAAVVLLFAARSGLRLHRAVGTGSCVALLAVALRLVVSAGVGEYGVYELGNWPPPFGIVLVLDRLSAFMLFLTALMSLLVLLHALGGWDARGRNFHALFQFQLMGLNGAFLTGDLFNLFVFFEILLIASYGLLLHGAGPERLRAGVHYVIFNLTGSALFLIAVGLLYGVTGTLNMADLAVKVPAVTQGDLGLVRAGALLLLVVFSVKAALLPLYFWLPAAYSAASAPVAALFAIMTKVGVYAILRVYPLVFGEAAGPLANVAAPWLLPAALLTLGLGTAGVLAAGWLRRMVAYLVIASVGTMLTAVSLFSAEAISAALYYMAHTTFAVAGLFLLCELIARERGPQADRLEPALPVARPGLLGGLYLLGAISIAGLPPLSGFLGKLLVLESALGTAAEAWIFAVVLSTSLLGIVALSRAGSLLFWRPEAASPMAAPGGATGPALPHRGRRIDWLPAAVLLALAALLAGLAGPVSEYTRATARQLLDPAAYVEGVLRPAGLAAEVTR